MSNDDLEKKHCVPCEGGVQPLDMTAAKQIGEAIDSNWIISDDAKEIVREFKFSNYTKTISFVNAVAWVADAEDHHPEMEVHYGSCKVTYSTHSIGGLSENDFICAKKIDNITS
ncbi:MAG: 4a-hydroxytetrahydrobiopterin dehydratase [Gammaproteobacteria bacterium]|nr:4a-hydroxytetrahydrobiopterin dehydratase [Gammaproteobacteria bacterium]MDC0186413.1 4a-hydroxytetrahydrobiopterin dehydratase [Gammaproteobacteria bacterium]